jgi:hypothetical protein
LTINETPQVSNGTGGSDNKHEGSNNSKTLQVKEKTYGIMGKSSKKFKGKRLAGETSALQSIELNMDT